MRTIEVRGIRLGEGMPKICVPIVGQTREEIIKEAKSIVGEPADLVEWRVDWYEDVFDGQKVTVLLGELREVLGDMPILFTFRSKTEGGEKEIDEMTYSMLNRLAIDSGAIDLVDVEIYQVNEELDAILDCAHKKDVKVIGSSHNFEKTPEKEQLINTVCYMEKLGVDISKLAVMPQDARDVITLLEAAEEIVRDYAKNPVITMSMAGQGAISRVAGEVFGTAVTFGSVSKASAPGQINVRDLKKMLEIVHDAR